jgi:hypothetical protein
MIDCLEFGFGSLLRKELLLHSVQIDPGAHNSYLMCKQVVSLGVKRQVREADNLPSSSIEVKNGGTVIPLSHTSPYLRA